MTDAVAGAVRDALRAADDAAADNAAGLGARPAAGARQDGNARLDVVVLASGVNHVPLWEGYVPGEKALIPFRGRASVQYVLDALDGVAAVGNVCVLGPKKTLEAELAARLAAAGGGRLSVVEGGETFLDSLAIGLNRFRDARAVLFVTGDAPLIRPEAIREFLAACAQGAPTGYEQNLYISVAPRTSYTGPYARFTKPFNRFRDVAICHGNLFLMSPTLLDNAHLRERVNRMYARRKNLLSVVEAFGWRVALTYVIGAELLRRVTLGEMAAIASKAVGVGLVPVVVPDPDITMDIDEPDDYEFVRDRIDERAAAAAAARPDRRARGGGAVERLAS